MPDSAVPRNPDVSSDDTVPSAKAGRRSPARTAQRVAQLREAIRPGETLDLFAEDAERATQQAMNTDIRQGTFEGFELPEVFLAAVESSARRRAARAAAPAEAREETPMQGELIADSPDTPDSGDEGPTLLATAPAFHAPDAVSLDRHVAAVGSHWFQSFAWLLCAMLATYATVIAQPTTCIPTLPDLFSAR
ncbi:hypothetical protein [Caballeronia sp. SL2Y3]|uniref:hypothetical protein n=1 Tax=Caballeronia sp. SL2Y3 TaxID=2878151 RepID=UPI001FD42416|nr:hypothetical protein [Caballeronia sp. SL2Y3]